MSILIFALVVILVVALALYAVDYFIGGAPFGNIVKGVIVLIAILVILQRSGLLG